MRCRSCGRHFPLTQFADMLDEDWENYYASFPMDRL
ncbi:dual CXXC motif small (seleno)protein [Fundidesulfovibrio magnetotacticus]|nr:dual CXXC motif small (seleno)protein [Fundidesulfovibrio magnetotacticus]